MAAERFNAGVPMNSASTSETSFHDLAETDPGEMEFLGQILWDTAKPNGWPGRGLDGSRAREPFAFEHRPNRTVQRYLEACRMGKLF